MQTTKRKKRILVTVLVVVLVAILSISVFAACAGMDSPNDWFDDGGSNNNASPPPDAPGGDAGNGSGGDSIIDGEFFNEPSSPTRLIVYTVTMTIHSYSFSDALLFLRGSLNNDLSTAPAQREWFDSQQIQYQERVAVLVARVHHTRVHAFVDIMIAEFGMNAIRHLNEQAQDVSLTHHDRALRIAEQERYLEWLHEELERALSFTARAPIQTRINAAQLTLNQLITAQNTVNQQIEFSTVTITLRETDPPIVDEDREPSRVAVVFGNVWMVISNILIMFLYIIAALLPFAAIGVPLFFLIRHLVRKRKAQRLAMVGGIGGMGGGGYQSNCPPTQGQQGNE